MQRRAKRARTQGQWHVRFGSDGTANLKTDAQRFYFNLLPAYAVALADAIADKLDGRGVARYSLKIVNDVGLFDNPVPAVLFVERANYEVGRQVALGVARRLAGALGSEIAPLTKWLAVLPMSPVESGSRTISPAAASER